MNHVKKSVLLPYSPREMYALVTAVDDYPKFLPWCDRAEVTESTPDGMVARLGLAFGGVRQTFTTRNRHVPDGRVELRLVEGPFSSLEGTWSFTPLGDAGDACRVDFELRYAFASRMLATLVSPVFDKIADTLVDSFVRRAEQVYGAR